MSYKQLLNQMKTVGQKYRADHAEKDKDGKTTKVKKIAPREVANLLEQQLEFGRVVDDISNNTERAAADLMFRDPDSQIFVRNSEGLRDFINKIEQNTTDTQAKKVLYWIKHDTPYVQRTQKTYLVPVGNGVFNLRTKQLERYDGYVFTSKVATDYVDHPTVPDLNGWRVDKWIADDICDGRPDKQKLLWQAIYCVINPNDNKKGCLLMVDDNEGNTGKGTFQELLTQLVGKENRADLTLDQFENEFELASVANKALIIGDDNEPDMFIKSTRSLKSIVAKEQILLNPKMETPFSYTVTAFIVQSMNGTPRFQDKSGALYDRFRAIKFNKRYDDGEVNLDVKDKYVKDPRVLEWVLYRALQVKPFARMIKTAESSEVIMSAKLDSDPVLEFLEEHLDEFKSAYVSSEALYNIFRTVYQHENGQKSQIKQRRFTQRAKPIMARHGWSFAKWWRGYKYWDEDDKRHFMERYDANALNGAPWTYQYGFVVDSSTKGGFYKPDVCGSHE